MQDRILTIVVPSYNVERYLEKGLSTFTDEYFKGRLDLIVVDDGSKDSTPQIAQHFVDSHPDIFRLVSKPNGGHGSVLNKGLELSRGKYFRIVDGDDWVNTDALIRLLDVLECTDADLIIDERVDVDMSTGDEALNKLDASVSLHTIMPIEDALEHTFMQDAVHIHMLTVKTSLLRDQKIRVLENTFYEDYEFMCKVLTLADTVQFENIPVYHYLRGNAQQSVSDENYVKHWEDHARVTKEVLRFFSEDAQNLSQRKRAFLERKIPLFINTGYSITLIFDPNRKRGYKRAREYREYLQKNHPEFAEFTDRRYRIAKLLHALGVRSQKSLDKLTGRR